MAAAFSESSGKVRSSNRLTTMALSGLAGGGLGFLLSQIPSEPTQDSQLQSYTGLTFMLIIVAIGAALIAGNALLDGHPPSGEIIAMAAVALAVLGFLSGYIAQSLYASMIDDAEIAACIEYSCYANAVRPARTLGWGLAGALGGVGIGLAFRSKKRLQNAVIGGAVGGLIGGFLFDLIPQIFETDSPTIPRLVAVCAIGVLIGVLIAAIDAARTDMFLEVMSGEMRGRQFLVMDTTTRIGSARSAGVVLVADRDIAEVHLTIDRAPGEGATFTCATQRPVMLNGVPATSGSLGHGDMLVIGHTEVRVGFKKATGLPPGAPPASPSSSSPTTPRPTATQATSGSLPTDPAAPHPPSPYTTPTTRPTTTPPQAAPRPRLPTKPKQ